MQRNCITIYCLHEEKRLLTAHSEALQYMMNDSGIMDTTIRLRILQLQQQEWLHESPLILWPYNNTANFKDWLLCLLCNWKHLNISFDLNDVRPNLVLGGNTPISSFIQHNYRGIAKELWRYSLLFIEQLVNVNGNQMLTYYDYCI
ncbi:3268_t:CDS:2 [Funneliformis geosporum]|nr:3268_t:CDS:2 [Funneliformis geosporum]